VVDRTMLSVFANWAEVLSVLRESGIRLEAMAYG
jgi:hypothetical protein